MTNKVSDRKATYEVIKRVSGQTNILTIPRVYMDITGNIKSALFLSQCVYWADKMGRAFYKSHKDWENEIGLSRYDIDNARKECKGIVITKLRKANGSPTLHYAVDWKRLYEEIEKLANGFAENSQMDLLETDKSLTETTTETTTDIINAQEILPNQNQSALEENEMRTKEELMKGTEDALFKSLSSPIIDYAQYPEELVPVVERMDKIWRFKTPLTKKDRDFKKWIVSCGDLLNACGEYGVDLLDEMRSAWVEGMESHEGRIPYNVSDPQSLIKTMQGFYASKRRGEKYVFMYPSYIKEKRAHHSMVDV